VAIRGRQDLGVPATAAGEPEQRLVDDLQDERPALLRGQLVDAAGQRDPRELEAVRRIQVDLAEQAFSGRVDMSEEPDAWCAVLDAACGHALAIALANPAGGLDEGVLLGRLRPRTVRETGHRPKLDGPQNGHQNLRSVVKNFHSKSSRCHPLV